MKRVRLNPPPRRQPTPADPVFCKLLTDIRVAADLGAGRWGRVCQKDQDDCAELVHETARLLASYLAALGRAGVE